METTPKTIALLAELASEARYDVNREADFRGSSWDVAVERLAAIEAAQAEMAA